MNGTKFKADCNSLLKDIPVNSPSLERAQALQSVASSNGFDWADIGPVFEKIYEELAELKAEVKSAQTNVLHDDYAQNVLRQDERIECEQQQKRLEDEFGDVLFCCVNLARFINVKPEQALASTNDKFLRRFQFIEKQLFESGSDFKEASLDELDEAWELAKKAGL